MGKLLPLSVILNLLTNTRAVALKVPVPRHNLARRANLKLPCGIARRGADGRLAGIARLPRFEMGWLRRVSICLSTVRCELCEPSRK